MSDVHQLSVAARRIADELFRRLETQGYRGRIVPIKRLRDLKLEIEAQRRERRLVEEIENKWLNFFDFGAPARDNACKSIIIVAAPQPHIRLMFEKDGRTLPIVIPPTYSAKIDDRLQVMMLETLSPAGYRLSPALIPKKLLAVRSGLAGYGKNNLVYVEGMGSYCRLATFFSDLPSPDDDWYDLRYEQQCESCKACHKMCPTKAISPGRFLLHAERCLTLHNEGEVDFPQWIDSSWHHCLIGCLYCQSYCPMNKDVPLQMETAAVFSAAETEAILQGAGIEDLADHVKQNLEEFGLLDSLPKTARNLRVLLETPQNIDNAQKLIRDGRGGGKTNGSSK